MIAVLEWCDGFGNDTIVAGIFDNVETAKKVFAPYPECDGSHEVRYIEIEMNKQTYYDYYEGKPLYPKKKRKKRI